MSRTNCARYMRLGYCPANDLCSFHFRAQDTGEELWVEPMIDGTTVMVYRWLYNWQPWRLLRIQGFVTKGGGLVDAHPPPF